MRLAVDERLHPEADAVYSGCSQSGECSVCKLPGRALHRDLGARIHVELRADGCEEPRNQFRSQQTWRATAEINAVNRARQSDA